MVFGAWLILSSHRRLHGYNGPSPHYEREAVVFLKNPFLLWDHVEDKRNTNLKKNYFKNLQV